MKTILIDSYYHFAFRLADDGHAVEMLRFPTDCPRMGDREEYSLDEGELADTLYFGERVRFDYGKAKLADGKTYQGARFTLEVAKSLVDDTIRCGDDLRYFLSDICRSQPDARADW
jgi:hypothetical protein